MDAHLGILIAAEFSARLLVDQLAEAVEERALARLEAGREQRLVDAERRELAHRMRQQRDADAELLHLRRALIDATRDAAPMQVQRQRQAGDAAADDGDIVVSGCHGYVVTSKHLSDYTLPRRVGVM